MLALTLIKSLIYEDADQVDPYAAPAETNIERADRLARKTTHWAEITDARADRAAEQIAKELGKKANRDVFTPWVSQDDKHHYVQIGERAYVLKKVAENPAYARQMKLFFKSMRASEIADHARKVAEEAKRAAKKDLTTQAKNAIAATATNVKEIPSAQVPKTIVIPGGSGRGIDNPYWTKPARRYAGPPAGAPLHSTQLLLMHKINTVLQRHGITPLNVAYVGFHQHNSSYLSNFIIMNPSGSVVWRKYDVGGGSGQNWVYLNGQKTQTSNLTEVPPQDQDDLLRKSGLIK
jgi:hypothetical protein